MLRNTHTPKSSRPWLQQNLGPPNAKFLHQCHRTGPFFPENSQDELHFPIFSVCFNILLIKSLSSTITFIIAFNMETSAPGRNCNICVAIFQPPPARVHNDQFFHVLQPFEISCGNWMVLIDLLQLR